MLRRLSFEFLMLNLFVRDRNNESSCFVSCRSKICVEERGCSSSSAQWLSNTFLFNKRLSWSVFGYFRCGLDYLCFHLFRLNLLRFLLCANHYFLNHFLFRLLDYFLRLIGRSNRFHKVIMRLWFYVIRVCLKQNILAQISAETYRNIKLIISWCS